ncbi:MAG: efflux RND transporter periplasmic adaptor subunit [Roseobacter sp.]
MRIFSLLAALAVATALYFAIVERDRFFAMIGHETVAVPVRDSQAELPEPDTSSDTLVKVIVRASTAEAVETAVALRGETRAARVVDVKSETSAVVVSEPLRKGQSVQAGQALCRLDTGARDTALAQAQAQLEEARARVPEAQAMVAQSQAQLAEARIDQNASSKLSEGGFASTTRVANAEANVATALAGVESARAGLSASQAGIQAAEAGVASAQKEIDQLVISAPFAGLLESDSAELGALLQPGSLCATVIQLDPIKLVAFVPETEVARVILGAPARATLATGQSDVMGRVTFISRSADEMTRTFRVEIEVANASQAISDGQTAEILIAGEGAKAHLLPQSALTLNDDGILGIRSVDDAAIVAFHPVDLLRDTPDGVLLGGLPDTLNVIVLGQEYVIAGIKVAPSFEDLSQ